VVNELEVAFFPGRIDVALRASQDVTPEVEGARFKAEMLERALEVAIGIDVPAGTAYVAEFGESDASDAEIEAVSLSG
jgi:hypothetical protein